MNSFFNDNHVELIGFYVFFLIFCKIKISKYLRNICTFIIPGLKEPPVFNPLVISPATYKCFPCVYHIHQKNADSTKYDFLCSIYFNKIIGLFPYVRTFRQNNKNSPIIIFLNEEGFLKIKYLDKVALFNCGVTIFNSGKVHNHLRGLQIVRLIYFYDFLKTCKHYFKRCIFTDGFDVFFQGDPFTTDLKATNLYLTIESETNNFLNTSYYEKFPSYYKIICSHNIVNCGVFAGGTSLLCKFLSVYLKMFPGIIGIESQTINYNNPYSDQDALNYFVYVYIKKIPSLRKNLVLLNTSSPFASMIGEIRYNTPNVTWEFPEFSVFYNGIRNRPLLVHQYTYHGKLTASLLKVCGLLEHQKNYTDYYRV